MNRYEFHLSISPEQYLDYYRGTVRHVFVRSNSGQTIQFPASLLQRFVVKEGICGDFVLVCDQNNKCIDLQRLGGERAHAYDLLLEYMPLYWRLLFIGLVTSGSTLSVGS